MLILKTLSLEPMHGFGIARRVEQISRGVFKVNPGSLLVALQRLDRVGWLDAEWTDTENGRRARVYKRRARDVLKLTRSVEPPPTGRGRAVGSGPSAEQPRRTPWRSGGRRSRTERADVRPNAPRVWDAQRWKLAAAISARKTTRGGPTCGAASTPRGQRFNGSRLQGSRVQTVH